MGTSGQDNTSWQTGHLSFELVVSLLEKLAITAADVEVTLQTARRLKIAIDEKVLLDSSTFMINLLWNQMVP